MVSDIVYAEIIGTERMHERKAREHYTRLLDEMGPRRPNALRRGLRALTTRSAAGMPRGDHSSRDRIALGSPAAR